jgi:hypothetical protein
MKNNEIINQLHKVELGTGNKIKVRMGQTAQRTSNLSFQTVHTKNGMIRQLACVRDKQFTQNSVTKPKSKIPLEELPQLRR